MFLFRRRIKKILNYYIIQFEKQITEPVVENKFNELLSQNQNEALAAYRTARDGSALESLKGISSQDALPILYLAIAKDFSHWNTFSDDLAISVVNEAFSKRFSSDTLSSPINDLIRDYIRAEIAAEIENNDPDDYGVPGFTFRIRGNVFVQSYIRSVLSEDNEISHHMSQSEDMQKSNASYVRGAQDRINRPKDGQGAAENDLLERGIQSTKRSLPLDASSVLQGASSSGAGQTEARINRESVNDSASVSSWNTSRPTKEQVKPLYSSNPKPF